MAKNKTKDEIRADFEKEARKKFLDECNDALQPIFDKHSMRLVPVVNNFSTEYKFHLEAGFAVQRFTKEEVKVQKGNETLASESKADERADSDSEAPTE